MGDRMENNYFREVLVSSILKKMALLFCIFLIGLYLFCWFHYKGVYITESTTDIKAYVNGFKNSTLFGTVFNLGTGEIGYRPRLMSFIVEWFDTKMWIALNKLVPWGGRYPATLLGIPMVIWGGYYVLKKVSEDNKYIWIKRVIPVLLLFLPCYLSTSFLFLRSAKVLVPGVSLCITALSIGLGEYAGTKENRRHFWLLEILIAFILSVIVTLDEQIVASLLVISVILLTDNFFNQRKLFDVKVRLPFETFLLYILFYKWWGRWMFQYYTPYTIGEHLHTYNMAFSGAVANIYKGAVVWIRSLKYTFGNTYLLLALVGFIFGVLLVIAGWRARVIALELLCSSIVLCAGIVAAHPPIYSFYNCSHGMYVLLPVFFSLFSFFILAFNIERDKLSRMKNVTRIFLISSPLLIICVSFFFSIIHIKEISVDMITYASAYPESYSFEDERKENLYNEEPILYYGINESYFTRLIINTNEYDDYIQ